jgi:hypothetical protein
MCLAVELTCILALLYDLGNIQDESRTASGSVLFVQVARRRARLALGEGIRNLLSLGGEGIIYNRKIMGIS